MKKQVMFVLTLIMGAVLCALFSGCGLKGSTKDDPPEPADKKEAKEGRVEGYITGIVCEGEFYHDGREEWIKYYYVDIGEEQYAKLDEELGGVYDSGQEVKTEIQIYTTIQYLNLKDFVGTEISFKGSPFEGNTIYHRRNIVFDIEEIYGANGPELSGYVPMEPPGGVLLTTEDGPLAPDFVGYGTPFWVNERQAVARGSDAGSAGAGADGNDPGSAGAGADGNDPGSAGGAGSGSGSVGAGKAADGKYVWDEFEDGSGAYCLMVLIDTSGGKGGDNDNLFLPGYGAPEAVKNSDHIHITWKDPADPDNMIQLVFGEGGNWMAVAANTPKGIVPSGESDTIEMPVSVRDDGSGRGCFYIPLYALLNEVGGGAMLDPFGDGVAFIFTGGMLEGYTGVWEVADSELEYRVDVDMGGKTVSVGNYWQKLSLSPDGTFTETNQYYQDSGYWIKLELDGEYAFFGRLLAMKYTTDTEYRDKDFNKLAPVKVDAPHEGWDGTQGVEVFARYVDDWDTADVISIRGYKTLYSYDRAGRQW